MKSGQLMCHGTIPELKQRYGQGFTVLLKLKPPLLNIVVNSTETDHGIVSNGVLSPGDSQRQLLQDSSRTRTNNGEVIKLKEDFEHQYRGQTTLKDQHSVSNNIFDRLTEVLW